MRKNILALSFVMLAILAFCSCGDDDEVVLSSDCYISSFSLGSVLRKAVTTSSTGEDSTYIATYNASSYYMTINQLDGTIENKEPLPYNSLKRAILVSIETTGTVIYRPENDENWRAYSSTDSIDFTNPLIFRVISADGMSSRDYTAKVNVRQVDGDEFVWTKLSEPGLWSSAERLKTMVWNDNVWVFAQEGATVRAFYADAGEGVQWTEVELEGCGNADVKTLTVFDGRLYMSCSDGTLVASDDAQDWTTVATERNDMHLLTADDTYLYAMSGTLCRSTDGVSWTDEELDEVSDSLPVRDLASVSYIQSDGLRKVLLIGNRSLTDDAEGNHAVVWGRGARTATSDASWMYYNWTADNFYVCPRMSPLELVHYYNVLMVVGGASIGGGGHEALDGLYVSQDNGVTWKTSSVYMLPEPVRKSRSAFTMATDAQNYLWLVVGDQVWRGRLNKLGF